jgi:hypothetical protein
MTLEDFRSMIPGYLAGQLAAADRTRFEASVRERRDFQEELEELGSIWEALGSLPEEQPSPAMRARFYQRLNDLNRGQSASTAAQYTWWKPGLSGLVRQVTVVMALFCLGIYVGRVSLGGNDQTAQLREQVQGLRQAVALSLLDRQSASSRLEGISWSNRVEHPDSDLIAALLNALDHDPNTNVRLASLDALEKFNGEPAVRRALVSSLPRQTSPLVQIALIDGLVQMRNQSAEGELRTLSRSIQADAAVRERAQWGLQRLSF